MNRLVKRKKQVLNVLLMTAVLMAWGFGAGFAEEAIKMLPINPVPGLNEGAPEPVLDGRGVIQFVEGNEMVIGDIRFQILNETAYYLSDGTPAFSSEFEIGKIVGYRLNAKRQIIELWALNIQP